MKDDDDRWRNLFAVKMRDIELCLALFLVVAAGFSGAKKQNKELQIITEFKPEECSAYAEAGDQVEVHYTGYLDSGAVFDSSRQQNRGPLPFVLGQSQVISGWEQGIKGMCVGEKRKLIIPPHLAYGAEGHPPTIPAEATLTFETELVSLKKKPIEEVIFKTLRFLAIPVAVIWVVYYLYGKFQKLPTKKELKEEKRRGKKKTN